MPDKFAMRRGALILAGGGSTRMGRPKESLPFQGDTLLGRTAAALAAACDPVVVVARDGSQTLPPLPPGCDVAGDDVPGGGPLAGLAGGLRRLRDRHGFGDDDAALLTGCDQPFWTAAAARWLFERLNAAPLLMPRVAGVLQPLAAVYRTGVLGAAERLLAAGVRTPRALVAQPGALVVEADDLRAADADLRFLIDLDTADDYRRALDR